VRVVAAALTILIPVAGCAGRPEPPPREFVRIDGTRLLRDGAPYHFVGPQGRNSVFATDASTLAVLEHHARRMKVVNR
jgi:hypothetical protein